MTLYPPVRDPNHDLYLMNPLLSYIEGGLVLITEQIFSEGYKINFLTKTE